MQQKHYRFMMTFVTMRRCHILYVMLNSVLTSQNSLQDRVGENYLLTRKLFFLFSRKCENSRNFVLHKFFVLRLFSRKSRVFFAKTKKADFRKNVAYFLRQFSRKSHMFFAKIMAKTNKVDFCKKFRENECNFHKTVAKTKISC
jgi:hypothetical protein